MKLIGFLSAGLVASLAVCRWIEDSQVDQTADVHFAARPDSVSAAQPSSDRPSVTLRECSAILERGRDWLRTVPAYTGTFRKQERLGDELQNQEMIEMTLRHQPFSVKLHWPENGRIVYFLDGTNRNRIAVRMGGWKGRLGWINLDPHSSLAMAEARYPVTDAGLLGLTEQLLKQWRPFLDRQDGVACEWQEDATVGGRRCRVVNVEYAGPDVHPDSRHSVVWIDAEWSVPLMVRNYDWQTGDPSNPDGLVEYYLYENLTFDVELEDRDFQVSGADEEPRVALQAGAE